MTNNSSRWGWKRPGSHATGAGTSGSSVASTSLLNKDVEEKASSSLVNEDVEAQDSDRARASDRKLSSPGQMREIVRGVISVTVDRAENLVCQDFISKSDPYVVLKTRKGKQRKQSKVVYDCLNPKWDQTFDFLVEDGVHEMLDIKVWDHDTFGRDSMGSCATSLTSAIHNGEDKAEFKLDGVDSGVIFLTLKWIPVPFEKEKPKCFGLSMHSTS